MYIMTHKTILISIKLSGCNLFSKGSLYFVVVVQSHCEQAALFINCNSVIKHVIHLSRFLRTVNIKVTNKQFLSLDPSDSWSHVGTKDVGHGLFPTRSGMGGRYPAWEGQ